MREVSSGYFAALVVLLVTLWAGRAAAWTPPEAMTVAQRFEGPCKTIKLRAIARKVFGFGIASRDNDPLWVGPLRVTLQWRVAWKWNEPSLDSMRPHGLRGGPVLSFDMPLGRLLSLEQRMGSFRYVYARSNSERLASEELADPKGEHRSLEAGLFLNVHLAGLL
ncbi:MAG: hypothetical protein ACOY0T_30795 [Myxococcota bacterium]